jgi:hypothetical protein
MIASATPSAAATASPSPTAAPTAAATANLFSYAGSLVETYTLYGTPAPAPSGSASPAPTATPWITTISNAVTQSVRATTGASFGGASGLAELATSETDTSAHATTTSTAQTFFALVGDAARVSGVDVTEAGTTANDSNGVSYETTFGAGNGIVEELPPVPNARWSDSAARTQTEVDPDGQTTTATYAADGTYAETFSYPQGGTAEALTYGDGSGVYQVPVAGTTQQNSSITVDAPAVAAGGDTILIGYSVYGAGLPAAGGFTIEDWYPATPPVLANDQYVDEGPAALPAACNVPASLATGTIDAIAEAKTRLDTLFGELETDQTTEYVSATYGILCSAIATDLKNYYDYSAQSSSLFSFSSTPIYETTIAETLGLTGASVASAATARARASAMIRPSFAHVRSVLAQYRARMLFALHARMLSRKAAR